jgi:zinc protease
MLPRGTTNRSALQIASATDFVGASVQTTSDTEAVRFSAKGLSKDFGLVIDVLSDELRNPAFPQDQIDRLRGELISNLEQEKEAPDQQAGRAFNRAIFPPGHPYRQQTIDEDRSVIGSISRDDLVGFHNSYYGPDTAVIVIVGDVTTDEAVAAVEQSFGNWQPTGQPKTLSIPDAPLAARPSQEVIPMMDKSQVNVVFGTSSQLTRKNPDYYAANVMNYILGGGGGLESRLGTRIRGRMGLVYFVYTGFDASIGAGPWMGSFGTNPANVDKAISSANQVISDYIKTGPTKKEFGEAIDYIVGVFPIRLETNDGVANVLLSSEFYGLGLDYIQRYPKIYRSVTLDQVRQAARKYLHPDDLTVVIAGPYNKKAK